MKLDYLTIPTYKLHEIAWRIFSEYTRRNEMGKCITCGKVHPWKETHAGHFIHGDALDFIEENIHCQCIFCNHFKSGNAGPYEETMKAKYGKDIKEKLKLLKNKKKYSRDELTYIIKTYKIKIKELKDMED